MDAELPSIVIAAGLEIPVRTGDTIPVFGDSRFAVVVVPWQVRPPRDSLTVVAKATCAIVPNVPAEFFAEPDLPTGDVYGDDNPEKGLVYASITLAKRNVKIQSNGDCWVQIGNMGKMITKASKILLG